MTLANWFEPDSFRQFCLAEIFKFKTLDRAALRVSQPLDLCVQFCKVARHFRFGSCLYVLAVLGWEIIECQDHVTIFGQRFDRSLVSHTSNFKQKIKSDNGLLPCCGHTELLPSRLDLSIKRLWHYTRSIGHLVDSAALLSSDLMHLPHCYGSTALSAVPTSQI